MSLTIDLNVDLGEQPRALREGREEKILSLISSANIACGGHAGDESTMAEVLALCKKHEVAAGAHPSYPDRANFGRKAMHLTIHEMEECIFQQVQKLGRIAQAQHTELQHVKPHGALYHVAAIDERVAEAIALGVARWSRELILVGLANSAMLAAWQAMGFRVAAEAFVDRVYEADGMLRARTAADALIHEPAIACAQALHIITAQSVIAGDGTVVPLQAETLCIHSDTPNALAILTALCAALQHEGIAVSSLSKRKHA